MHRAIFTLLFILSPLLARANPVDCLLQVDGIRYINGICDMQPLQGGSFVMRGPDYIAVVMIEAPGVAEGFWSETPNSVRANAKLGLLVSAGACWTNDRVNICAWKLGEPRWFIH